MSESADRNPRHLTLRLPAGFDSEKHADGLPAYATKKTGEDGWVLIAIEGDKAIMARGNAATKVGAAKGRTLPLNLSNGVSAADGDRLAAKMAQHKPGYVLTYFDPHNGRALLTKLTPEEDRVRIAIASALSVKPWEVQIEGRDDGGFDFTLPPRYSTSRHKEALDNIAVEVAGTDGWYARVNSKTLRGSFNPSSPPTFPAVIPYPLRKPPRFTVQGKDWSKIPLGMKLPEAGQTKGEEFYLDLRNGMHIQLGGISDGGKSVLINDWIVGGLARGFELVVVDLPTKQVDFLWCKKYCRPSGWGCDDLAGAVTALSLVLEEVERRSTVLAEHGAQSWSALPDSMSEEFRPIMVIVDELTGLLAKESEPKALPKDHPMRVRAIEINTLKDMISVLVSRIAAESRFVAVSLLVSTQVASANTGIGPATRTNLHHKMLMGPSPTDGQRRLVFTDADSVPKVPDHVTDDPTASRGTGTAEPSGQRPTVLKSYFGTPKEFGEFLDSLGTPTNPSPEPTPAQITRFTPQFDDDDDEPRSRQKSKPSGFVAPSPAEAEAIRERMGDNWDVDPETGKRATGYAKANRARHESAKNQHN